MVKEAGENGREREHDRGAVRKILESVELNFEEEDIKFCKRVGQRGEEPRPLVVGFYTELEKSKVLRRAKLLDRTEFKHVHISQDLTNKQRQEEDKLRREADRRNENELTEEDKSKNLKWAVVGARGERRLVKTTAWNHQEGAWMTSRGATRGTRGATRATRARGRPSTVAATSYPATQHQGPQQSQRQDRRGTRRPRSEDEEDLELEDCPPNPKK